MMGCDGMIRGWLLRFRRLFRGNRCNCRSMVKFLDISFVSNSNSDANATFQKWNFRP